jgi:transforming growth factor-beta-induced protein
VIDTVLTIPVSDMVTAQVLGLSSLAGALKKANLATVNGLSDLTIFAPTNAAFQAIGATAESLSSTDLAGILEYHVIQNTVGYSPLLKRLFGSGSFRKRRGTSAFI